MKKKTTQLLTGALVAGLLSAGVVYANDEAQPETDAAVAAESTGDAAPAKDMKDSCKGHKDSCKGHKKHKKHGKGHHKDSCGGKDGCGKKMKKK